MKTVQLSGAHRLPEPNGIQTLHVFSSVLSLEPLGLILFAHSNLYQLTELTSVGLLLT